MNKQELIKETPLVLNKRLSNEIKANIYLKREDLQTTRSFKIRGAYNKIISNQCHQNIVTCSAGNHAQGVAHICKILNIKCYIFIPLCTPLQKQNQIKKYGNGELVLNIIGDNFNESLQISQKFAEENNYLFVHPYNDFDVIGGQSQISLEINCEIKPDFIICPIGGGGLISGQLLYARDYIKNYQIIGVEPKNADSMKQSLIQNMPIEITNFDTFVDGCAVKKPGDITFNICKQYLKTENIIVVDNYELCDTIIKLYQDDGIITEPAGGLSVAALRQLSQQTNLENKNIVCIISGGNNDVLRYNDFIEKSLIYQQLVYYFIIKFNQKPGSLESFVNNILSGTGIDIIRFEYLKKTNRNYGQVLLGLQLKQKTDISILYNRLQENKIDFINIDHNNPLFNFIIY